MREPQDKTAKPRAEPVEVKVKPHTYQPSKAELEADIRVDATSEELRATLTRTVKIKTEE